MFNLGIPTSTLDDAILFIERVTNLYDECYGVPRRLGVKGVRLRNNEAQYLHQALNYLTSVSVNSGSRFAPENAAKVVTLTERLRALGKQFCFNGHGYVHREFEENSKIGKINFNEPLTHIHEIPFFVWGPESSVESALYSTSDHYADVDWRDRSLGRIYRHKQGDVEETIQVHGLTIFKSPNRLPKGGKADTRLDIEYNWDCMEGFNNRVTIFFKEGTIVHVSETNDFEVLASFGRSGTRKFDSVEEALGHVSRIVHVPEGLFAYYILASNLTEGHKRDLGFQPNSIDSIFGIVNEFSFPLFTAGTTSGLLLPASSEVGDITLERRVVPFATPEPSLRNVGASATSARSTRNTRNYLLAEDHDIDPDTLKPLYKQLQFYKLTPDEFLSSQLPEENYECVVITFMSEKGHKYEVYHGISLNGDYGINVRAYQADIENLESVTDIITRGFNGIIHNPEGHDLFDKGVAGHTISIPLDLPERSLSFAIMKSAFRGYQQLFKDVSIYFISVRDISSEALATANIPLDQRVWYEPKACVLR